jgi:hypothetical protein
LAWLTAILLTASGATLGEPLLPGGSLALAGHTLAGGDCWQAGTPLLCRTTWNNTYRQVDLSLFDQFSQVRPAWETNAETACNNWHNYSPASDILCHWTPVGASRIYLKTGTNGTHDLSSSIYAVTWNCNINHVCLDTNTAQNIWYTEIYFNTSGSLDGVSSAVRTKVFAHELGHALGLYHHETVGYLMRQGPYTTSGPSAGDYGQLPACSGGATTWGVRCIYHFTQ